MAEVHSRRGDERGRRFAPADGCDETAAQGVAVPMHRSAPKEEPAHAEQARDEAQEEAQERAHEEAQEEEAQEDAKRKASEEERIIRAAYVLLETVRNTGKAVLLFEPSGLAAFAALSAIIDRREGRWAEAVMIFGDARGFADRHSAALGEKSGSWKRKIKNAGKAAAKGSAGYGLEDASLADEFIARNPEQIFRQKSSGALFFWSGFLEREWRTDKDVRPWITAFLKQVAKTHPAEKDRLLSIHTLKAVYAAVRPVASRRRSRS